MRVPHSPDEPRTHRRVFNVHDRLSPTHILLLQELQTLLHHLQTQVMIVISRFPAEQFPQMQINRVQVSFHDSLKVQIRLFAGFHGRLLTVWFFQR
ncbi:hypothetical protein L596_017319 [Steinernema carpocapsae]|uniref:Uncharacterized protein n=1 Tax=Steinernema carpocapsae TaxID=34508 RepID=A0A4U5N1J6_STECR|nr:hypothetical protein L596_017319 [Steinernema carpocapsae]